MTTLTIEIPDQITDEVSKLIETKGGHVIANSKSDLSKAKQLSLNQSLKEAESIKKGNLKALGFNDLWND